MQSQGQTPIDTLQQGGNQPYTPLQVDPVDDPLAQLRDIHVPDNVDIWPLDWGWWVLLIVALVSFALLVRWTVAKIRFNRPRKQALALLKTIDASQENWPIALNALLKRTALTYCINENIAGLHGNAWHAFLLSHITKGKADIAKGFELLAQNTYQRNVCQQDFTACHLAVTRWISHANFTRVSTTNTIKEETNHA